MSQHPRRRGLFGEPAEFATDEVVIDALAAHEGLRHPVLDELTSLQHENAVEVAERREAMSDSDHGLSQLISRQSGNEIALGRRPTTNESDSRLAATIGRGPCFTNMCHAREREHPEYHDAKGLLCAAFGGFPAHVVASSCPTAGSPLSRG